MNHDSVTAWLDFFGWQLTEVREDFQDWASPYGHSVIVPTNTSKPDYERLNTRAWNKLAIVHAPELFRIVRAVINDVGCLCSQSDTVCPIHTIIPENRP